MIVAATAPFSPGRRVNLPATWPESCGYLSRPRLSANGAPGMTIHGFSFGPTTPVAFGAGRLDQIAGDVGKLAGGGAPVLVVADPALAKLAERTSALLAKAGCKPTLFTDIQSDPLASQVDGAAEAARRAGARCLVGVGGGSTLDVTKLAAAIAPDGREAEHYALAKNGRI